MLRNHRCRPLLAMTCGGALFLLASGAVAQTERRSGREGPQKGAAVGSSKLRAHGEVPHADALTAPSAKPVVTAPQRAPFQPLTETEQKRLHQILDYWQHTSAKVKTYSSHFTRFDYDAVFGPRDKRLPKSKSAGTIRYAAPDKGEFKIELVGTYTPPQQPGTTPTWPMKKTDHAEHWICDGTSVYEMNGQTKQLIVQKLPQNMRGKFIADGPLPFMFGAKKEKILQRYWMRELIPPQQRKGEYWLEAWPKRRADAANFQRVRVILDEKKFLPKAMEIFPPNYDERSNTSREVYTFSDLKVNDPLHRGQEWLGGFISPRPPIGWKTVVTDYGESPAATTAANPGRSQPPAAGQR